MEGRAIGWIIAGVIFMVAIGYKFTQRDEAGEDYRQQMMVFVEQLPDYDTHGSLYLQWFDANHDDCFEANYHIGGRRSQSWFDGNAYLDELFIAMASDAAAAGYTEQAQHIRDLAEEVYWE